jgi:hypothetical protein
LRSSTTDGYGATPLPNSDAVSSFHFTHPLIDHVVPRAMPPIPIDKGVQQLSVGGDAIPLMVKT